MRKLLLCLCLSLALVSCKKEKTSEKKEVVIKPVKVMQVSPDKELEIRKFPGKAQAFNYVTLAFEVSGKLNDISIYVGDKVKKGDVLASVDSRDFQNALNSAEAELKRSKTQYERVKQAFQSNAVSKQDLTNAEAAYEGAQANVDISRKALEDTQLKAPYDGTISAKYIRGFGNVMAKQPAIRLVDPSRIEMVVDVPEDLISYAKEDMKAKVVFDSFPNSEFEATIHEIGTEASLDTRTYPVTLIMDNPNESILPGMSGSARVDGKYLPEDIADKLRGIDIPLSAIFSDSSSSKFVWVLDTKDNTVHKRKIETENLTKNGITVNGIKDGEIIVTAGVNSLEENQQVRVSKERLQ